MTSSIDPQALFGWCRIASAELEDHPQAKARLKILPRPDDVHRWVAQDMIAEIKANDAANQPTRWIIPTGPTGQYPYFINQVNQERINLHRLHIFHMDDYLDWEGRHLPPDHAFNLESWMRHNFYDRIDPDLTVPEAQRHFPSIYHLDAMSEAIATVGGIDTTYGGVGYRGHIAFNEPPLSPWHTITTEQFHNSKTRIVPLNVDSIIARSQRDVGGCSHAVPPMAITLGMKDLLSARRIRLFSDTGAWKQTVVRIYLFGPVTTEYPVTFVQEHPDALYIIDKNTATPPLEG